MNKEERESAREAIELINEITRKVNQKSWEKYLESNVTLSDCTSALKVLYKLKDYGMAVEEIEEAITKSFYNPLREERNKREREMRKVNANLLRKGIRNDD